MRKFAIAALTAVTMSGAFAADIAAGQAKSAVCAACHGANGISVVPTFPKLAGQHEAYLALSLRAFKSQDRKGAQAATMWGIAASLSDADIDNLAAYYSSLSPTGN